jgi:hypothetical protein
LHSPYQQSLLFTTGLLLHISNMYFHFRWLLYSLHMSVHPKVLRKWTLDFLSWTWSWKDKEQSMLQQVCDFLVEFAKYFNLCFCILTHWQLLFYAIASSKTYLKVCFMFIYHTLLSNGHCLELYITF